MCDSLQEPTIYLIITIVLQTNTFQCVLAVVGTQSYAIYLYADGLIQWTTGDDNGGRGGLGGNEALAGYANTTITSYTIPGSRTDAILGIASTTNIGVPGMWVFRLDEEELVLPNSDQNTRGKYWGHQEALMILGNWYMDLESTIYKCK